MGSPLSVLGVDMPCLACAPGCEGGMAGIQLRWGSFVPSSAASLRAEPTGRAVGPPTAAERRLTLFTPFDPPPTASARRPVGFVFAAGRSTSHGLTRRAEDSTPYLRAVLPADQKIAVRPSELMRPIIGTGAKLFPHGIVPDIMMLGVFLMGIAQAMIKEPVLPDDAKLPCGVAFPMFEQVLHRCFSRKTQDRMEVVGHEQPKGDVPLPLIVIEPRRIKQC